MKLFNRNPKYESEHTLFIKELKAKKPHLDEAQRAGRALLWDLPPVSLAEQERIAESRLKQPAYVYQNNF
ncbi:MAG: DUF3460 family protein [Gammaproteobacteria bacterium]